LQVVLLSVSAALCFAEETPASTATLALQPVVHPIASPYPYLIPTVAAVKVSSLYMGKQCSSHDLRIKVASNICYQKKQKFQQKV
jgi:hypothetical protein